MKTVMNKELVLSTLKKVVSYGVIVGALVLGFFIGRYTPKLSTYTRIKFIFKHSLFLQCFNCGK
jgi:membrane-bound metal-dependent hydrolase YbcI (DUF457 family)